MEFIDDFTDSKKDAAQKQGALYTLMALVENFGKLIEPFIVKIISILMKLFGDPV